MLIAREFAKISKLTLTGWWEIKAPRLGAALAYYTILSLAPTIILATPLIGLVFRNPEKATKGIVEQFQQLVGQEGAGGRGGARLPPRIPADAPDDVPRDRRADLRRHGRLRPTPGIAQHRLGRGPAGFGKHAIISFLRQRFVSFAMVLGLAFLLLVSLVFSAWP